MQNSGFLNIMLNEITTNVHITKYHNLKNIPWDNKLNKLNHNIFYFILDGEGQINVADKNYFPTKGDLVLLPCNQYHFAKSINDNHYIKYSCYFSAKIKERDIFEIISTPVCVNIQEYDTIESIFKELSDIMLKQEKSISEQILTHSILSKIISLYFKNCNINSISIVNNKYSNDIKIAIEYIHNNITTHITIETLAKLSNFHPNYFIRLFKNTIGVSPIKYINDLKLKKMKDELLYTNKSINEIANDFNMTYKNFVSMFNKYYGISPSKLRKI